MSIQAYINRSIPAIDIVNRVDDEFVTQNTFDLFRGKRVVLFAVPGAFTPTCSSQQLPGFEEAYDEITSLGVDEVYCVSVNDAFVMNAWFKDAGIEKVKPLPDGNYEFTQGVSSVVEKSNVGFGFRSWRYACVINNNKIEWVGTEEGQRDDADNDAYEESTPDKVLEYLKSSS